MESKIYYKVTAYSSTRRIIKSGVYRLFKPTVTNKIIEDAKKIKEIIKVKNYYFLIEPKIKIKGRREINIALEEFTIDELKELSTIKNIESDMDRYLKEEKKYIKS